MDRFSIAHVTAAAGASRSQLASWRRRGLLQTSYGARGDGQGACSRRDAAAVAFLAAAAREHPHVPARVFAPAVRLLQRGRAAEGARLVLVRERVRERSRSVAAWGLRADDDVADLDPAHVFPLRDLIEAAVERVVARLGSAAE